MTMQRLARHCIAALALTAAAFTTAQAQPSAAGTVTPPVRADMALRGSVLASRNVADHRACHSECQRTPGCTGYSFDRAPKVNCTLLGGTLSDVAVTGAVSCRMPCEANPRASVLPQKLPHTILRNPPPASLPVPDRPVSLLQGAPALPLRQLPATAAAGSGTASNQAASFGTGLPPSTTLPPCVPGRTSVVGSCGGGAVVAATPASAPAPAPVNTTITLVPINDNTIGSTSLNAATQNTVWQTNYWFPSPGIGMGCNLLYGASTRFQNMHCARGLIKFNLTSLAGKNILSATLRLNTSAFGVGAYKDPWYVAASASPWSGSSVTWINYGDLAYTPSKTTQSAPTYVGQVFNLDQTATVRNWLSGAYVNNGFAMALNAETLHCTSCDSLNAFEFHSNEDPGSRGPKLIVTYQ